MLVVPRRSASAIGAFCVLSGAAAAVGDASSTEKRRITLELAGTPLKEIEVCGQPRTATLATQNAQIVAGVSIAVRPGSPRRHIGGRLLTERCHAGRWRRMSSQPFAAVRRGRRVFRRQGLRVDTARIGDYRLRAVAGQRRSRSGYLRVVAPPTAETRAATSVTLTIETRGPWAHITYSLPYIYYEHGFKGEVTSTLAECVESRVVEVYRAGGQRPYAMTKTGSDGRYWAYESWHTRPGEAPYGDYYAKVTEQGICEGATSGVANSPKDVERTGPMD